MSTLKEQIGIRMSEGVRIFTLNTGEQTSTKVALELTQARRKLVIRLTGGFGLMSVEDGERGIRLLVDAFAGFDGTLLYGGTRVVRRSDPRCIFPTLAEVPCLLRETSPFAKILGVVPRKDEPILLPNIGLVIGEDKEFDQYTIIHPEQEVCMLVQKSVDDPAPWDAEVRECLNLVELLRNYAHWDSLLVSYNGGKVTEREINLWADRGWPVLLITGGGRVTDQLANDQQWLEHHPSVTVVESDVFAIRRIIHPDEREENGSRSASTIHSPTQWGNAPHDHESRRTPPSFVRTHRF